VFDLIRGNVEINRKTTAIILAAGKSKRLGEPKALLKCGDKTLIEFLIERLELFNLNIIIVTNNNLSRKIKSLTKSTNSTIITPLDSTHRTGNLIAGLIAAKKPKKILVVPIDRPGWSLKTLEKLLEMNITCCPEYNGKGGHPLLICDNDVEKLINSSIDTPLNSIFKTKRIKVNDPELHLNIDTKEDIKKLDNYIKNIVT